jgi:hypothetical protein
MVTKILNYKRILLSLFLGSLTFWLMKKEMTPFLLDGKYFDARSELVQIGILISLIVLTSLFFLCVIAICGSFFSRKFGPIFRKMVQAVKTIHSTMSKKWVLVLFQIDTVLSDLQLYLKENAYLIFTLAAIALAAYGFELFNLNLTIDEEVHAANSAPSISWVIQGRWGMYLLNKFVIPYTVIPFVPLFVALIFHIGAVLLMLKSWGVQSRLEQLVVGAVCIAFPIMAYMYTFSTINYGIGIGLFCVALSLFIYSKKNGLKRLYAVIPAAFSIAIYQGFIPALIAVFLVYLISTIIFSDKIRFKDFAVISFIHILALLAYFVIQRLLITIMEIPHDPYVSDFFDLSFLVNNLGATLSQTFSHLSSIYSGKKSLYAVDIKALGILLLFSFLGLIVNLLLSKLSELNKLLIIVFSLLLLVLPFASGLLMRGVVIPRSLIALPIVISGIIMLGMLNSSRTFKIFVALLTVICIFQFLMSTNHLFAASHLALQEDRSLATRLIERIENVQVETGREELRYMEVIGYDSRPATELIPKIETFGASFFEWDQGSSGRILLFLQTMGFSGVGPLPLEKRVQMVEIADSMPVWPRNGSVMVVGNVVLVKLGPYSDVQKQAICGSGQYEKLIQIKGFCK